MTLKEAGYFITVVSQHWVDPSVPQLIGTPAVDVRAQWPQPGRTAEDKLCLGFLQVCLIIFPALKYLFISGMSLVIPQ